MFLDCLTDRLTSQVFWDCDWLSHKSSVLVLWLTVSQVKYSRTVWLCLRSGVLGLFGFNTLTKDVNEVVLTCSELDAMAVYQETKAPALALPAGFSALPQEVMSLDQVATIVFRQLFVGCLTSQQHASVSQAQICSDNFTCCHTEMEVADQTFHLTQSQYTDTRPTSPSTDPVTPGAWHGSHWSSIFKSLVWLNPEKILAQSGYFSTARHF